VEIALPTPWFDRLARRCVTVLMLSCSLLAAPSWAQVPSRNLAPGFTSLPADVQVAVMPLDVELFELSLGGVLTPKADWTASASTHMGAALKTKAVSLGFNSKFVDERISDDHAELLHLYGAVARSISMHHAGAFKLPTKEERLEWSFGDALRPLREATGARYGLFTWVRDSYSSAERKAAMVGLALVGIGISGGAQVGYASLVDLESGQVLWFNQNISAFGDLRDEKSALSSMDGLLAGFPGAVKK
jgi:hypothetical protein